MKNKFLICVYFLLTLGISSLVIVESIFAFDESNNKLSRSNYEQMMIQAFEFVKENYVDPVSDEVIFEGALKGIFQSLGDPYSQYLTKKDLEEISKTTVGDYVGIGISIIKKCIPKISKTRQKILILIVLVFLLLRLLKEVRLIRLELNLEIVLPLLMARVFILWK